MTIQTTNPTDSQHTPVVSSMSVPYTPRIDPEAITRALMAGDVSKLQPADRVQFYTALCHSVGLNVLTRPFILLKGQDGALSWYATVGAGEQLRKLHRVSTTILSRERTEDGLYCITVKAWVPDGREEESQGIVWVGGMKGADLANALMRAESKAKRRATLAICGLGMAGAEEESGQVVPFDPQTGDVQMAPEPAEEAGTLLTTVGKWFRDRPKDARETIAQAIWGCTLHEMPHLSLDDLAAGWHRLDEGRAPLQWDSETLAEDMAQWREQHAREAVRDVFGEEERA